MPLPSAAPMDPRVTWGLPALGSLATVERLDEVVTRVLGPNPSPMTLDGTNTYVIGATGAGEVLVVDPGPEDPEHLAAVERVVAGLDSAVRAIVVTHHHLDHAAAAGAWAERFGVQVLAAGPLAGTTSVPVTDGERIGVAGLDVEVVATPGHTRDHVALRVGTGALLTGDHVLGRGTSVVTHPDGDLEAYLASLRRALDLGPDVLYPGHGPALAEDPGAVLQYYLEHRRYREQQILASLARGPASPRQLVEQIYADVARHLWDAAEASTRAAVAMLVGRGQVEHTTDDVVRLAA